MSPSRSRKSLLELYAEPFADLPPLAGIIAGAVLGLAGWVAPLFAGGSAMTGVWLQFGRWFLWLFAVAVLVYTGGGALRRAFDRKTFDATDDPAGLSWIQFERYVAEFYRRQGATVTPRGGSTADGGVDLNVRHVSGERLIVQCKHWRNRRVGVKPLRELWGVLPDENADGAVFITSGSFSADALAFATGKRLELIDGTKLRTIIAAVKRTGAAEWATAPAPAAAVPKCPHCGSPMVLRTATRGANAGEKFWGCSTYPGCRGTRQASG